MVSYAHPDHLPMVADVAQSFALDNGAFTAWQSGKPFDFAGFVEWVDQWHRHPGCDWVLAPDVIDGSEAENDAMLWDFVHRFGLSPWIVPVWHFHESIGRLRRLCGAFYRVALGSSGQWPTPGTDSWWERVNEFMPAICNGGVPICKLHGLRMLSPDVFTRLPLASADSTNAAVNAGAAKRFGMYPAPLAADRAGTIASRIEAHNSAAAWEPMEVTSELLFA